MGAAAGSAGSCPADGQQHQDDGGDHILAFIDSGDAGAQSGWNECSKCSALFLNSGGNLCPATKGPHTAFNPTLVDPGRLHLGGGWTGNHVLHYAVLFDRSNQLPHGRAMTSSAVVDLKINTETCIGYYAVCSGSWSSDPQSPWQLHFVGQPSDNIATAELALQMSPRGGCEVTALLLSFTPSAMSAIQSQLGGSSSIGMFLAVLASGAIGSPNPVPCTNFFAGSFDDCEYGDGSNNNGVGTILSAGLGALQLWPKREDRIRIDLMIPGMRAIDLELDTHE